MIWSCAGVLGLDPAPFSIREICKMSDARERSEWWRAAFVVAHLLAPWAKDGKGPSPRDLHPMESARNVAIPGTVQDLRVFLGGGAS